MNLYTDPWIPVRGSSAPLGLKQVLCEPGDWQLSLPRDDMELACLQLLVSLVQGALPPEDRQAWRRRMAAPLTGVEYGEFIRRACDGEDGPGTYGWDEGIAP